MPAPASKGRGAFTDVSDELPTQGSFFPFRRIWWNQSIDSSTSIPTGKKKKKDTSKSILLILETCLLLLLNRYYE